MANKEYPYIRFKVLESKHIQKLFEQLGDELRPFELVISPPIGKTGTRAVTIRATSHEDAKYFSGILMKLSKEPFRIAYNDGTD